MSRKDRSAKPKIGEKAGTETLKQIAAGLPGKPGIYFFKDLRGEVVYIGKARSLRDRVRSYFQATSETKIANILAETASIDFILTRSEREAAFLESNFIQQHRPKFNLRLKDDKSFPYLKLTVQEKFPGIYFTRRVEKDGARYYGPFSPAHQARTTIQLLGKYFGIRTCREKIPGHRKRPCLEHDLELCSAPCTSAVSEQEYRERVSDAQLFLEGRVEELLRSTRRRMREAAGRQAFEAAARWRDIAVAVEQIRDKPQAISVRTENLDIFGFHRQAKRASIYLFLMRRGKIRESFGWIASAPDNRGEKEILAEQAAVFYNGRLDLPDKILLPFAPAALAGGITGLKTGTGRAIPLHIPHRGRYRRLVELADRNAVNLILRDEDENAPLSMLAKALGLPAPPALIEGYDISNTGGTETVGSQVVFRFGFPDKSAYRKFRIKTVKGPDDIAGLEEVLTRRFARLQQDERAAPDLVLIDGGKGQLNAARGVLLELGFERIPLISLAKREELIYSKGFPEGLRLERTSPALRLLQHVRDEAHRFAVSFHRTRRDKRSFASPLDGIPGIGPKRKAALLEHYSTLAHIQKASEDELASLIGRRAARALQDRFDPN